MFEVLAAWPTPPVLKHSGKAIIDAKLTKHGARWHTAWAGANLDAVEEQTVVVVGAEAAGLVIPHLARPLIATHSQRADVAMHLEAMVESHSICPVLTSMPGVAVRIAAFFIASDLLQDLRHCRSTGRLCWAGTNHEAVGHLDHLRTRRPFRQLAPEASVVPFGVRDPPFSIRLAAPTMTGSEPRENVITRRSSRWPIAG